MVSPFLGEMLGTMTLLFLGNGVVAGVLLQDSKAQNAGWIAITAGWAFAVLSGIFVAIATGSPDAHINPAVTLAFAVVSGDWSKLAIYVPAQLIGGFIGASLVWLHYLPHWAKTDDPSLKLAVFCTGPAIRNTPLNLLSEILATAVLIFVVAAMTSKSAGGAAGIPAGLIPYFIGMLIWGIGLSLGGTTGYALNPARDLPPRLAHAILPIAGKAGSDWGYAAIPVIGSLAGGVLAAFALRLIGV